MTPVLPLLMLMLFQDSSDPEWTIQERFRVDFVRLDILALYKDGSPVTDLKKTDFSIKENGKTMSLEIFDSLDYRSAFEPVKPGEQRVKIDVGVDPQDAPPVPQFIFATDLESVPLVEMRKAITQLRDAFANGDFPPGADYLLYSMESGVLTDGFVNGTDAMLAALNQFEDRLSSRYLAEINGRSNSNLQAVRGAGRSSTGPRGLDGLESHVDFCLLPLKKARVNPEDYRIANDCISDSVEAFVDDEILTVRRVIGELESLTYRFQDKAGLKTLFFISPGFSLHPGREAGEMAAFLMRQFTGGPETMPFGSFNRSPNMEDEFKKVTHACIRNRVVFHTFDIFGTANEQRNVHGRWHGGKNSATKSFHRDYLRSYSSGLSVLATESGGFHLRAPDFSNGLAKVIPKLRFYYLMGYASPNGKPGKYRKIKIKCKRKGVKLHYRRGYFGGN